MHIRIIFYIFGGIAFIGLFTYAFATMHQFDLRTNGLTYLNDKLLEQQSFILELNAQSSEKTTPKDNSSATTNIDNDRVNNYFDYSGAPIDLDNNASFQRARGRHLELKAAFSKLRTSTTEIKLQAIIPAVEAAQSELSQAKQSQIVYIKQELSKFVWICAILFVISISAVAIPFIIQHRRALTEARTTNDRLKLKAQELSATHTTMGNMLEDIVHERRQATRTAEINARLAAIINSADDAIFSLNLAGLIATANQAALKNFGDHIIGKRFTQLFPGETAEKLRTLLMATNEQNSGATFDISVDNNKQRLDLSLTLSPIRSDLQKLVGFSVIAKDISNTKLEEERFRLAVEAAPNAMIMVNQHGYIVLVNSEVEQMFGYTRDELLGQSIHILVPTNIRNIHTEHLKSYLNKPDRRAMGQNVRELNGQKKDSSRFPIEVGLTPIHIDHEIYVISSIVDISGRLAQQSALQQLNSELSRKNSEMEQFIYAVSHDLKAPLVTIAGFAERLLTEPDIQQNSRYSHKIERIISNVKSMDALLKDLLHLSRVIKRDLEKGWVDTNSILEQMIDSLELNIKRAGAEIRLIKPFHHIYAQESLLYQCVQNIVSNALKYKKADQHPIITISPIKDQVTTGLIIADNGIGISPKHHSRIYNVFERLHPEISEGTGVGLSIVKTIMEKHNGKIILASEEGEGCQFTLLFPVPPSNNNDESKDG